uniref:Uncharacterized protein n=1 Tax=Strigamia maritima TaxID=126957 RepID=T1J3L6_STRMM
MDRTLPTTDRQLPAASLAPLYVSLRQLSSFITSGLFHHRHCTIRSIGKTRDATSKSSVRFAPTVCLICEPSADCDQLSIQA